MKTLRDFDVRGKKVLVRCDFNVPLDERGNILDDFRIRQTIPTIGYLIKKGAKIILMSHLGRSEGEVVEGIRLSPIAKRLSELLSQPVTKLDDCTGSEVAGSIEKMETGEIILLENLRFHKEEEENNDNFARELAKLGDIYINDAFGASHRNHASIVGVPKYLPSGAGFLLAQEIENLTKLMENPEKPLVAIMGGAKVEEKAGLINRISAVADYILIGGLIKKEIKEKDIQLKYPRKIIEPIDEIGGGKDIGPETVELFKEKIFSAKTIFFNGVLGIVEKEEYSKGTEEILKAIAGSGAFSVIGGGDMIKVINKLSLIEKFNHVSTGGGAMLEFLSGEKLPGIEALK